MVRSTGVKCEVTGLRLCWVSSGMDVVQSLKEQARQARSAVLRDYRQLRAAMIGRSGRTRTPPSLELRIMDM